MDGLAYYKAATPEPWTILGLRLHPFSLGHVHLLHRFESGFVNPDGAPGVGDLVLAIFICSRTYQETLEALENESLDRFLYSWGRKLSHPTWLHRMGLRRPIDVDWPAKLQSFAAYVREGSTHPAFSFPDGPAQTSIAPLPLIVRSFLLKHTSLTDRDLWDRPWGLCLWDFITIRSFDGSVRLIDSDSVKEAYEAAKAFAEKLEMQQHGSGDQMQS